MRIKTITHNFVDGVCCAAIIKLCSPEAEVSVQFLADSPIQAEDLRISLCDTPTADETFVTDLPLDSITKKSAACWIRAGSGRGLLFWINHHRDSNIEGLPDDNRLLTYLVSSEHSSAVIVAGILRFRAPKEVSERVTTLCMVADAMAGGEANPKHIELASKLYKAIQEQGCRQVYDSIIAGEFMYA